MALYGYVSYTGVSSLAILSLKKVNIKILELLILFFTLSNLSPHPSSDISALNTEIMLSRPYCIQCKNFATMYLYNREEWIVLAKKQASKWLQIKIPYCNFTMIFFYKLQQAASLNDNKLMFNHIFEVSLWLF